MKRFNILIILLTLLIFICTMIICICSCMMMYDIDYFVENHYDNQESIQSSNNFLFIMQESDGFIGIFDASGVLVDTLNVKIKNLPELDRTMLQVGIKIKSYEELYSLIEDYT